MCLKQLLSRGKVQRCAYPVADLPYKETVYAPAVLESLTMKPPSLFCRGQQAQFFIFTASLLQMMNKSFNPWPILQLLMFNMNYNWS